MKIKTYYLLLIIIIGISSCSPKVKTTLTKKYPPLEYTQEVIVLNIHEPSPDNGENLGTIKIGDTGFSVNCGWNEVIENAKNEARKVGGNVVKITKHKLPSAMGSTCHRITAQVLRIPDSEKYTSAIEEVNADWDYALLHIYRPGGAGALVSYDLYLGGEVICRTKNKWKTTIKSPVTEEI